MSVVYLGNHRPVQNVLRLGVDGRANPTDNGAEQHDRTPLPGKQCTQATKPPEMSVEDFIAELTSPGRVWSAHSDAATPAWVASDDEALAARLGAIWGCEIREVETGGQP